MNEYLTAKDNANFYGSKLQRYGVFIFLIVLFAGNSIFTNNFFSINTLWLLIIQAFPIILCGLGMTLVIASGGIDISVGATLSFAGTVCATLYINKNIPFWLSVLSCLIAAVAVGVFNGFVIAKYRVQPIVMTLIMMLAVRGLAQVVTDGRPISFSYTILNKIAMFRFWKQGMPVQLIVALTMILLISYVIRRTVFGKQLQAMGDNKEAARLAGINTLAITIMVYAVCAFFGGLASVIEIGRLSNAEAALLGLNIEMDAIAAVAVGGTPMTGGKARVWGTVAGALIMQMTSMTINMNNILSSWGMVAKAAILIIAVFLQNSRAKS